MTRVSLASTAVWVVTIVALAATGWGDAADHGHRAGLTLDMILRDDC